MGLALRTRNSVLRGRGVDLVCGTMCRAPRADWCHAGPSSAAQGIEDVLWSSFFVMKERICPDCGIRHDRDINAAIDIKRFALQERDPVGVSGEEHAPLCLWTRLGEGGMNQEALSNRCGAVQSRIEHPLTGARSRAHL